MTDAAAAAAVRLPQTHQDFANDTQLFANSIHQASRHELAFLHICCTPNLYGENMPPKLFKGFVFVLTCGSATAGLYPLLQME